MIEHGTRSATELTSRRGEVVVSLSEDLDLAPLASLSQLLARFDGLESIDLVVDLSEVTVMDTPSASLLVRAAALLAEQSCVLSFRSLQPIVRKMLVRHGATEEQVGSSPQSTQHLARIG